MKTTILLTVEHDKPIPELTDFVAQRAWTIDGVNVGNQQSAVTARQLVGNELARVNAVIREEDEDRLHPVAA